MKMLNEIYIELTNLCNCSCVTCPQSVYKSSMSHNEFNRPKGIMSVDLFQNILLQAWEFTNTINFSYFGEHTLHPNFSDILLSMKFRPVGKKIHIFTNFLNITEKHLDAIVTSNVNHLNISLDAVTEPTYEKIRCGKHCVDLDGNLFNGSRFSKVTEKIESWFRRADHVPTRHEFTISKNNYHEIKSFVNRWLPFLSPYDSIVTKNILTYGGVMFDDPFIRENHCSMCNDRDYLVITWDGKVGLCFLDTNMELCIGDANTQSLSEIISSPKRQETIRCVSNKSLKVCKNCVDADNRISDRVFTSKSIWSVSDESYYRRFKL